MGWPFFYHRADVIETYDLLTRKLRCQDCGRYFAMSDRYGAILPWDDDYEKLTRDLYGVPRSKL